MESVLDQLKADGNKQFGLGKLGAAVATYTEAIVMVPAPAPSDLKPRLSVLYSNRAMCQKALGNWAEVDADASAAIQHDHFNCKAHYLKGLCSCRSQDWLSGIRSLEKAMEMARRQKKPPALLKEFEGAIAAGRYEWHAASSAGDRAADLDLQSWMETVLGEHKNRAMEEARGVRVVGSGSAGAESPSPLKSNLSELVSAPELSSSGGSSNTANSNTNSSNGAAAVASSQPSAPEAVSLPAPAPAAAPSSASVWKSLQMRLAQDQPSPVAATAATPSLVTIEAAAGLNNNRPPTASSASAAASSSLNAHRPGTASMLNARSRPGTARPGTAGAMKRYEAEIDHMSSPPLELPSASPGSRSSASNSHNSSGQGSDTGVRSSGSVTATTLEAFINAGTDARGTGRDTEYVNGTSTSCGNGVAGAASPFSFSAVSPLEAVCAEIEAEHLHRTADIAQLFAEREHNRTDRRIPDYFCCCITTELMLDPVVTPYGHSYERGPIEHYLRKIKPEDPQTRKPLTVEQLIPNIALKQAISSWLNEHPWAHPQLPRDPATGEVSVTGMAAGGSGGGDG